MNDRLAITELFSALSDGAGADLRAGGQGADSYLLLKDFRAEARRVERDALQSGDPDINPLTAGLKAWSEVANRAQALLTSSSKDLQVAAWLCEALLRTDGFAGLAAGIELLAGLMESWWDNGLYPAADEDGEETRIAPLIGLFGRGDAGTLLQPIKLLPLTDYGAAPVALWTVETIRAQSARHDDPEIREQMAERRRERLDAIGDAIARASPGFAADTIRALRDAKEALDRLMTAVDERTALGRFGSQVARPLDDALTLLLEYHSKVIDQEYLPMNESSDIEPESAAAPAVITTRPPPAPAHSAISDREAALATLIEIATFFERTEPQSLVGQSLKDVVRRAKLPLEALLAELIPENDQRAMFLQRAGIQSARQGDQSSSY